MPTSTIIILAILAVLLPWTVYRLLRDLVRKLGIGADGRRRDDEIGAAIEAEREADRRRMGSMFASSPFGGRRPDDG